MSQLGNTFCTDKELGLGLAKEQLVSSAAAHAYVKALDKKEIGRAKANQPPIEDALDTYRDSQDSDSPIDIEAIKRVIALVKTDFYTATPAVFSKKFFGLLRDEKIHVEEGGDGSDSDSDSGKRKRESEELAQLNKRLGAARPTDIERELTEAQGKVKKLKQELALAKKRL